MLTIESLIAVLAFGLTCFEIDIHSETKHTKNNRPSPCKTWAVILINHRG